MQQRTALWLSHHFPAEYDRCMSIRGRHVCRRCAFFYPTCFAAMFLALAGTRWPQAVDAWMLWLLPLPVVAEWWLDHLGLIGYSAVRNTAFTLICAPAVGVGLALYMRDQGNLLFWSVVVTYGVACLVPMLISRRRRRAATAADPPRRAAEPVR